jgi:two-component system OmpR family response regulator
VTTRLLYVDDEADIREVAELALSLDSSFEVRTCASGEEAIAIAPEWCPDLILLDVMMPGMDGPTAFERLRKLPETAATTIVFITARTQAREVERFKAMGAAGVIAKPFDPMGLARIVRAYLPP